MAETITTELPGKEQRQAMDEAMQPYRKQVTESAPLTSLLYDIDLLPEQIKLPVNVSRLIAVCELFKRVPADALKEMMSAANVDD